MVHRIPFICTRRRLTLRGQRLSGELLGAYPLVQGRGGGVLHRVRPCPRVRACLCILRGSGD